jgi:Bax protein
MNYRLQPIRQDSAQVPRIDVLNIPADWPDITSEVKRKSGFFRTVLPLVLIANDRIADDRARVLELKQALDGGDELGHSDHTWLNELAARYGIHMDKSTHPSTTVDKLLPRVDGIPPSLALAQAAIESGWGRSRFALEGNALFGQWTFDGDGMKPLLAPEDSTHSVASFDSLLESVEAYMLNLNSQGAYADLRKIRAAQRAQGHVADGLTLASTLMHYSQEGAAYPAKLSSIIRSNKLSALDQAILNLEVAGMVVATR